MKKLLLLIFFGILGFQGYSQYTYNGSTQHRFKTDYGYIDLGPFNTGWAHFYTDRPNIIFNKDIYTTTNAFSSYNNDLVLKTKGIERLRINAASGNVGIDIDSPDAKLAVNGVVHSKEVKVDLAGWSDFVFAEDYELPTLEEVEQHIKEKGHLKDIPSAKEVEENGIFLGEMDAKLLQKIEELTLYVLELKKENRQQHTRIDSLAEKTRKQQQEINQLKKK